MKYNINNKKNITVFIMYLLLLIPFFRPRSIGIFFPLLNSLIYTYFLFISFLVIVLMIFLNKKIKISKVSIIILLYLLYMFIITYYKKGDINNCIIDIVKISGITLLTDFGIKTNKKMFLSSFEFYLYILIIINLITIIIHPNGMYYDANGISDNWFLGYRNIHILFIFPAIVISFINSYITYGNLKIKNYILLIISFLTLILADSGTSLIGLLLILVYLLFNRCFNNERIFNIKNYIKIYIIVFFSIVVLRIENVILSFIATAIGRNMTFTGRIYIWDSIIELIKHNSIFGYGLEYTNIRFYKTVIPSYHAHNYILEILYRTGIIGLFIILRGYYFSFKQLYKYRTYKVARFLSFCMFILLIMLLTEFYALEYHIFLIVVCYNVNFLIKNDEVIK